VRGAVEGALLGALLGLLIALLGIPGVAAVHDTALVGSVGAALGALLGAAGWTRGLRLVGAPVLVLFLLVALVPWTGLAARWMRADPPPAGGVDAVVVLSAGMSGDSTISSGGLDRLLSGVELVRSGVAPRLITTRMVNRFGGVRVTNDADVRRIVHLAGLDSAWIMVDSARVTHDEANRTARLLLPGARRIVVVTSPSHTRRACATFEKVGFQVWCSPALERDQRSSRATTPDQRLGVFGALLYELAGSAKYRIMGWI
jgi:uncharacterized SAM-binding protein YcdF (DUF218 family)